MHQTDKVRKQQVKLLKEFPWLWAIRNNWKLGFHKIQVARLKFPSSMFKFSNYFEFGNLKEILDKKPSEQVEIWIYQEREDATSITQIPFDDQAESNLASIDMVILGQDEIKAIVAVSPISGLRRKFEIFLAHKQLGSYNIIIKLWQNPVIITTSEN